MQVTFRSLSREICVHFLVTSVDQFRDTVTSSFCVHFKPECRRRHSVANNLKGRSYGRQTGSVGCKSQLNIRKFVGFKLGFGFLATCLYEEHASHFVKSRIASSAT
ncbi:hypothetical protein T06_6419 [Trichinella sp. T6]|nr:hypothetical protein T06_6419 [Trichinella sp. T6]